MRERIDDPFILFDFPVHVRSGRRTGHADERDGLAAGDALADGHERRGRVVVTALDPFGVLHAHPAPPDLDPARGIDHTIVRGDDDRAEGRGYINPGMAALQELADRAGDGTNEAARSFLDAPETRARCWIGAEIGALPARNATAVELELGLVQAGPADAGEPASVRAERAGAEEIGKRRDRVVLPVRRVPHRYAVEDVAARNGRGDCAQGKTPVGGPSVSAPCEVG